MSLGPNVHTDNRAILDVHMFAGYTAYHNCFDFMLDLTFVHKLLFETTI